MIMIEQFYSPQNRNVMSFLWEELGKIKGLFGLLEQSGHSEHRQWWNMLTVTQAIFKSTHLWESAKRNNDGVVSRVSVPSIWR